MIDLQYFVLHHNGDQLPPIPYTQYVAKTGSDVLYNNITVHYVEADSYMYLQVHF